MTLIGTRSWGTVTSSTRLWTRCTQRWRQLGMVTWTLLLGKRGGPLSVTVGMRVAMGTLSLIMDSLWGIWGKGKERRWCRTAGSIRISLLCLMRTRNPVRSLSVTGVSSNPISLPFMTLESSATTQDRYFVSFLNQSLSPFRFVCLFFFPKQKLLLYFSSFLSLHMSQGVNFNALFFSSFSKRGIRIPCNCGNLAFIQLERFWPFDWDQTVGYFNFIWNWVQPKNNQLSDLDRTAQIALTVSMWDSRP